MVVTKEKIQEAADIYAQHLGTGIFNTEGKEPLSALSCFINPLSPLYCPWNIFPVRLYTAARQLFLHVLCVTCNHITMVASVLIKVETV